MCLYGGRHVDRSIILILIVGFTILFYAIVYNTEEIDDLNGKVNIEFIIVLVVCIILAVLVQ